MSNRNKAQNYFGGWICLDCGRAFYASDSADGECPACQKRKSVEISDIEIEKEEKQ